MIRRHIGKTGVEVNAIGLGCMGLSEFYGTARPLKESVALLHDAIDAGVDHYDTAEMYGMGANEELLGAAFHDRRDKVFIATKFGPLRDPETKRPSGVDGSRENCRRAIEASLKRLKTDHVDLYYLHRMDKRRPIEETVGAMAELVSEGKVRALGLSEVSADTIKRADAVHPITAVQSEYSIFTRVVEDGVLPAVAEIGASLVAYSPLGRGMLTGQFAADPEAAKRGDVRQMPYMPRFIGDNLENNLALVEEIKAVAAAKGATPAQVALAWVLARAPNVLVIPGTTRKANLDANLAAADVKLSSDETKRLDALADKVAGERYDARGMSAIDA